MAPKKKPFDPKTDVRVSKRPTDSKTHFDNSTANKIRTVVAAFEPWKETMKESNPDIDPIHYVSLYLATLNIEQMPVCESHLRRLLTGNRSVDGPGSGRAPAYSPHVTGPFLEYIVKDAKEEGLTVEKLYKKRGSAGSIISNKAKAFLGNTYGYTFTSKEDKKQLRNYLGRIAKPKIEEALKEESDDEEAVDGEVNF